MKLHELLVTSGALFFLAWIGCDAGEGLESKRGSSENVVEEAENNPLSLEAAGKVRNRANAAFDALNGRKSRFESRIGPQPWPRDLPQNWPRPRGASVLADTNGREEGRLLLIDLPDSIDQALDAYQLALRASGFEVVRAGTDGRGGALQASRGGMNATLRFFPRADSTRLEILFIAH
jgi:hypothetical protein